MTKISNSNLMWPVILIKIKLPPEDISANFLRWLEKLKGQLGNAFGSFSDEDINAGTAKLSLHPSASKYADMAIESSGFEIISKTA